MRNVSVIGNISIINLDESKYNASIPIRLSNFFGNLFATGVDRYVNQILSGNPTDPYVYCNLTSSLVYSINGVKITADNQTVTNNGTTLTVRLVSEFDSTQDGLNSTQIAGYQLTIPAYTSSEAALLAANKIYPYTHTITLFNGTILSNIKAYTGFNSS